VKFLIGKLHEIDYKTIFALCDDELVDTLLENGHKVSKKFYGDKLSKEEIIEFLHSAECVNILGEKSVNFALSEGIIDEKNIIKIGNISHVQIYKV
jgi:hypothetical protein